MLQRFGVSDDFAPAYRRDGYVVLRDVFPTGELERARDELYDLFETRFAAAGINGSSGSSLLAATYRSERGLWQQCARRMWDLMSVYSLAAGPRLADTLRRLGLERPMISTRPEVRTDMPGDERYMQPWHQDWRYGQGSLNAVTTWVPLHRVTAENGTIELVPGSHLLGYLEAVELENPRRFAIDEAAFDGLPREVAELEFGEAVVFSQMLVHRSGHNSSGTPRLTIQARFADFAEPAFLANGLPTPAGSELVWERTPTREEMLALFGEG
jgi:phytanoyl-CoA hydroxylase